MSQTNIRSSTIVSASSQQTNSQMPTGKCTNQSEFLNKKIKKEDGYAPSKGNTHDSSTPPGINSQSSHHGMESRADIGDPPQGHGLGSNQAGLQPGIQGGYPPGSVNGMPHTSMDPAGPLPNEIFELLNEFWRPNELVAPDTHFLNGKFTRRSPDGSLDGVAEEEKGKRRLKLCQCVNICVLCSAMLWSIFDILPTYLAALQKVSYFKSPAHHFGLVIDEHPHLLCLFFKIQ